VVKKGGVFSPLFSHFLAKKDPKGSFLVKNARGVQGGVQAKMAYLSHKTFFLHTLHTLHTFFH